MYALRKLLFLLVFTPFIAAAQTVIKGTVYDKADKKPIQGAVVSLLNDSAEITEYDISSDKGAFTLRTESAHQKLRLVSRLLGYAERQVEIENKSQQLDIFMEQTGIELKEVTVKSRPITMSEDTLRYSVSTFKSAGDRTIGDLLKKLPGVEVNKSGGITYKGEPINKFYIEGLDLLQNRYGIATNNVPVNAVQNVEVIENHQPVKSIKGMISSAQAAINLKLKDEKLSRPVGGIRAGGGYADQINLLLEIFALQASKKRQAIGMYKTNNSGSDISEELNEQTLSVKDLQNPSSSGLQKTILSSSALDNPPIEEERYLFNQSHVGTVNNLWKTGEDSQLRANINYLNDLITQHKTAESVYFLPDGSLSVIENNSLWKRQIQLDGALTYTDNAVKYYVENALQWKIKNDKTTSENITNNDVIHQNFDLPFVAVQNKLDYLKKWDDNIMNIGTFLAYTHQPEQLLVHKNGRHEVQNIGLSNFYAKTGSYYSWFWGLSSLRLNGVIEASLNNLSADVTGAKFTDSLKTKFQSNVLKFELTPTYSYKTRRTEFTFALPVTEQILWKDDKLYDKDFSKNYLFVNVNTNLSHTFNPFLSSGLSYRYTRSIGDYLDFMDSYLMKNYRSYYKPSGNISLSESQSFTLSLNYKNPLTTFFVNGMAAYIPAERNKMIAQRFVGIQSITGDVAAINKSDMWIGSLYIGKYFSKIKTNVSFTSNYNYYAATRLQQGILYPFTSNTLGVILKSNTKISDFLTFVYKIDYLYHRSKIEAVNTSNLSEIKQFGQQFITYVSPNKKLDFVLELEQSYNELSKNTSINMYFANVGVTYKLKSIDFELGWNNILNQKEYAYSMFNGLDTYNYRYAIRPMSVMLKASFKF